MKKITALFLTAALFFSFLPLSANAAPTWPTSRVDSHGEMMPFQPVKDYYSQQNPPCFTWPMISGATYELAVSADSEMKEIRYEAKDLEKNVYGFPYTFEADRVYYWSVRYKTSSGTYSEWREPSRFYIDADACEYVIPPIKDIGSLLKKEHPQFLLNEDLVAQMKETLEKDPALKKYFYTTADQWSTLRFPKHTGYYSRVEGQAVDWVQSNYWWPAVYTWTVATAYVISGDEKYLGSALTMLGDLCEWAPPEEVFEWHPDTDTYEAMFAYDLAVLYDWLYNDMSEELRQKVVRKIEQNIRRPYEDFDNGGDMNGSLYQYPMNSHAWRMNQVVIAALMIYDQSQLARDIVEFHFPLLTVVTYPFAYQDGATNEGMCYGLSPQTYYIGQLLSSMGVCNLDDSAFFRNEVKNLMYLYPAGWYNSWTDFWANYGADQTEWKEMMVAYSSFLQDENWKQIAKNEVNRALGGGSHFFTPYEPFTLFQNKNDNTEAKLATALPDGRYFPDRGWAALHSSVADENKIGLIFKANPRGLMSHQHADNNAFTIQGYGEPLAVDSYYYDYYNSPFSYAYGYQAYAHNVITYDDAAGAQQRHEWNAEAYTTGFLNHSGISLVSADGKNVFADKKAVGKADRNIIYLKPDLFLVIDDLASANEMKHTWEFWLNALDDIDVYQDKKGATITKGNAALDAQTHWPQGTETNYINGFAGPDLQMVTPPAKAADASDKRIYFQTPELNKTKMITTMQVRRSTEETQYIKSETFGDYMKMEFEGGAVAYINLTDAETVETQDGFTFSGTALVMQKESVMLHHGTSLTIDGVSILESDVPVSVTLNQKELAVSSIQKDANLRIYAPGVQKITQHYDARPREIAQGAMHNGILWNTDGTLLNLTLYPGTYTLFLNDAQLPGAEGNGVITIDIDGQKREIPFRGTYNIDGQLMNDFYFTDYDGMYELQEISGFSAKNTEKGTLLFLSPSVHYTTLSEKPYLKLKNLGGETLRVTQTADPKELQPDVACFKKADLFADGSLASTRVVHWDRIDGNTLQDFNSAGEQITWTLEVLEAGYYDVALSASTVSNTSPVRALRLNEGDWKTFTVPETTVYSDLDGYQVHCGVYLEAGKNDLTLMAVRDGEWILDWVGLIPASEPSYDFSDMQNYEWAKTAVHSLRKQGIVSGVSDTLFEPGRGVAREEFVKMIAGILKTDASENAAFSDVDPNAWYIPYLQKALGAKLVAGKPDGSFGIGEGLTREDMAVMICRCFRNAPEATGEAFADDGEISDYAKNAVYALRGMEIVNGTGENVFSPKSDVTRAEAAQIIYNLLQKASEGLQ